MNSIANTLITIYGGSSVDEYDDEVDADTVIMADVPAGISEARPVVETGTSSEPRRIRKATLRVKRTIPIEVGNRIKDQNTGDFYVVDFAGSLQGLAWTPDRRVDLRWHSKQA